MNSDSFQQRYFFRNSQNIHEPAEPESRPESSNEQRPRLNIKSDPEQKKKIEEEEKENEAKRLAKIFGNGKASASANLFKAAVEEVKKDQKEHANEPASTQASSENLGSQSVENVSESEA